MSKINLTPNASGTGVFTIASPNSNTDRTLNLPDVDGTVVTSDSSGNVGIGDATPSTTLGAYNGLSIDGGGNSGISLVGSAYASILMGAAADTDAGSIVYETVNNNMRFFTNTSEAMRIDSSGSLMVGTTSNFANAKIQATASNVNAYFKNTAPLGGTALRIDRTGSNGEAVTFIRGTTNVGNISVTASATSYNTSSDYRLKENVVSLDNATDRLNQIPVHRFNFIADPATTVDGFLAHEVQAIVPEAITGTKDEVDEEGNPVYQGIDQSKLVPLLVATVKELEARIAALEAN